MWLNLSCLVLLLCCCVELTEGIYPIIQRFLHIRTDPERIFPTFYTTFPLFNTSVGTSSSYTDVWMGIDKLRDASIWYYTGILRNPVTGNEIVGIEGLELVQKLIDKNNKCNSYWSRKVFVYTDLSNKAGNDTSLKSALRPLKHYRVKPTSPKREVNPVSLYNEIVSIDKNMTLVTMPNSRNIISNKFALQPIGGNNGYSIVHFIRGGKPSKSIAKSLLISQNSTSSQKSRVDKLLNNRWVSFSSPNNNMHGRSQEYYTISTKEVSSNFYNAKNVLHKPVAYIQYKRYGECPPWYSLGKACTTELNGYKYNNIRHIPKNVLELVANVCPEFYPVDVTSIRRGSSKYKGLCERYKSQREIHRNLWFDGQHDAYDDYPNWYDKLLGKK